MRYAPYDTENDLGPQRTETDGTPPQPNTSPQPAQAHRSGPDFDERVSRLLLQKKGPDAVMFGVLAVAFILGLIGLAAHVLWVVAIIVMALGLGFVIADSRRDRIEIANRQSEVSDKSSRDRS